MKNNDNQRPLQEIVQGIRLCVEHMSELDQEQIRDCIKKIKILVSEYGDAGGLAITLAYSEVLQEP